LCPLSRANPKTGGDTDAEDMRQLVGHLVTTGKTATFPDLIEIAGQNGWFGLESHSRGKEDSDPVQRSRLGKLF
jgi:hypothetical protein